MSDEANNSVDAKKHEEGRQKVLQKSRSTPIRRVPLVEAPSAAQIIIDNRLWYREVAKWSLLCAMVCVVSFLALSITLFKVATKEPETLSYLVDSDGRMVIAEPLSDPLLSDASMLMWSADRIKEIHTLAFTDYVDHIMSLSKHFTPVAFKNFQTSIIESKTIEKLKSKRLLMYMEPVEAPRIIKKGIANGRYTWVVEMKIKQIMEGGEYSQTGNILIVTMTAERVSRSQSLSGLVISKYLVRELGDEK